MFLHSSQRCDAGSRFDWRNSALTLKFCKALYYRLTVLLTHSLHARTRLYNTYDLRESQIDTEKLFLWSRD